MFRRRIVIVSLGLILAGLAAGPASAAARRGPLVLHPRLHLIAQHVDTVRTSGRYAILVRSGEGRNAILFNDVARTRTVVGNCMSPFVVGWPWLGGCGPNSDLLYDLRNGGYAPIAPCSACSYSGDGEFLIGKDWLWTDGLPCNPVCHPQFQNLSTGELRTWSPSATDLPDLNSPSLVRAVCAPLTVPPSWDGEAPPPLTFYGPFAYVEYGGGAFVQRCGSHIRHPPPPPLGFVIANRSMVLDYALESPAGSRFKGFLLPTFRRVSFTLPARSGFQELIDARLSSGRLYVQTLSHDVYAATLPTSWPHRRRRLRR
jgi:hypothetical protein